MYADIFSEKSREQRITRRETVSSFVGHFPFPKSKFMVDFFIINNLSSLTKFSTTTPLFGSAE